VTQSLKQKNETILPAESTSHQTEEILDELTELGMVLRVDSFAGGISEIAGGMVGQCVREEELELRECEVRGLQGRLEDELREMSLLRGRLEQSSRGQELKLDMIDEKISEWGRGIKLIQAKTEEYQSRTMNIKVSILHPLLKIPSFSSLRLRPSVRLMTLIPHRFLD
jgi:hypothetical protein